MLLLTSLLTSLTLAAAHGETPVASLPPAPAHQYAQDTQNAEDAPAAEPEAPPIDAGLASSSSDWSYLAALYLFAADIEGTVNGIDVDTPFSDTLDNLDFGGSAFFQAHRGDWGYQFDLTYMSLSSDVQPIPPASIEVVQDIALFEGDALWRVPGTEVDAILGLRYFDIDNEITPSMGTTQESGVGVLDPVLGVQATWDLARDWRLWARGDVGGFGISSDFTYQLYALVEWQFSDSFSASLGYRVLGYELDKSDVDLEDIRFQGGVLGLGWRL